MTWRTTRLKHLCADAGQYGLNVSAQGYSLNGHRLIRTSDVDHLGRLRPADGAVFVDVALDARHELRAGDLLLSRSGTIGRALLLDKLEEPCTFAGYLVRFRPLPSVDPRFLAYVAASAVFKAAIEADAIVTTIQNFNAERYANIELNVPLLAEQRRIAAFLDVETARIDALQHTRNAQLVALSELVASKISSLVPTASEARFVRLGYLAIVQSGITVDGNRDSGADAVTLPYLRVANVQAGQIDLDSVAEITVPRLAARPASLKRGDVLMTEGGDLDKLGRGTVWNAEIESCLHQNHVFAVRPDQTKVVPQYLALLTRTAYARSYFESTGTKTTNLASTSSSKIRDFRIPLLELSEQARVVQETNAWLEDIGNTEAALRRQLTLLAERRQALITAAVTGQIDVTTAGRFAAAATSATGGVA